MKRSIIILMLASAGIVAGCSSSRESAQRETAQAVPMTQNSQQIVAATPKVIIYKMRKDYSSHVPVTLSVDRKKIVAYPAISDIQIGGRFYLSDSFAEGLVVG